MTPLSRTALPVLIVDDEPSALRGMESMLLAAGHSGAISVQDSRRALGLVRERDPGVVLLDLTMPYLSGEELLEAIRAERPDVPVIVCTAANDVETAVRCMKAGAFDYMVKPIAASRLCSGVARALEMRELRQEYASFRRRVLADELERPEAFREIVARSTKMRSIFQYVEAVAVSKAPVLVTGETGVGKELLVRALHELSGRSGALVAVNVAGLDDAMFSDTLFGHAKGAFTGAAAPRGGLIRQAEGGTLFLDEIGDLLAVNQVKLLRLFQEGVYFPLGADLPRRTDARIAVATNRDVEAMRRAGEFRADLYYRLQTHHVHLPPLRERLEDLPLLVDHLLEKAAEALGRPKPKAPPRLAALLATHPFPGNIRELEALITDAVSRSPGDALSLETFREKLGAAAQGEALEALQAPPATDPAAPFADWTHLPTLRRAQELLIAEAMRRADGNQTTASRMLGITQSGLSKALKRRREAEDPGSREL